MKLTRRLGDWPEARFELTAPVPACWCYVQRESSRDELLAAVDVVCRAREGCVAHDVNGQRGDVSRSDDAPDGQRGAELVASLVEVLAED